MEPQVIFGQVLITLAIIVVAWPIVRELRLNSLRNRARQKMECGAQEAQGLREQMRFFTGQPMNQWELASYGTLTAAEYVWSWARIDPNVIDAAAFSSSVPVHNGYDFAQYIYQHYDTLGTAAKEGFFNRLMGYVGEQRVADLLAHHGHAVEFAANATQPVWDLMVDGHAVNVKTVHDVAAAKGEALAHHGVTYIVPEDAHGHLLDNMTHLAGFSHSATHATLEHGISAAHGETASHALGMHLPWLTVGFAAFRNYQAVQLGKDPRYAVAHGMIEIAGRGTGGVVGGKIGGAIGYAVGGPIGALVGAVGGAITGAIFGGTVADEVKRKPFEDASVKMRQALHEFGQAYEDRLQTIQGYAEAPLICMKAAMRELQTQLEQRRSTILWWIWPDFSTVLLEETANTGLRQIENEQTEVNRVISILHRAQRSGRYDGVGALMANAPAVRELIGTDAEKLQSIQQAQQKVFFHRKQLDPSFVAPAS